MFIITIIILIIMIVIIIVILYYLRFDILRPKATNAFNSLSIYPNSTTLLHVVTGGRSTLDIMLNSVRNGHRIVVVSESGRVSDLLTFAWRYQHDDSPMTKVYSSLSANLLCRVTATSLPCQASCN